MLICGKTMNIQKLIKTLSLFFMGGLFTACTTTHHAPASRHDYDRGYVRDYQLIEICEDEVRYKVERRFDSRTHVYFDYGEVYETSSYRVHVEGEALVKNRGDRHSLRYRCKMHRDDGRIIDVDLDWENRHEDDHHDHVHMAANSCQHRIRKKLRKQVDNNINIAFKEYETQRIAKNRIFVSGKAKVQAPAGNGKIRYECEVAKADAEVKSAQYNWIEPLPPGGGNKPIGSTGVKECHSALRQQLRVIGYDRVVFKTTEQKMLKSDIKQISGNMETHQNADKGYARYQCRLNIRTGKIKEATYSWGR